MYTHKQRAVIRTTLGLALTDLSRGDTDNFFDVLEWMTPDGFGLIGSSSWRDSLTVREEYVLPIYGYVKYLTAVYVRLGSAGIELPGLRDACDVNYRTRYQDWMAVVDAVCMSPFLACRGFLDCRIAIGVIQDTKGLVPSAALDQSLKIVMGSIRLIHDYDFVPGDVGSDELRPTKEYRE